MYSPVSDGHCSSHLEDDAKIYDETKNMDEIFI